MSVRGDRDAAGCHGALMAQVLTKAWSAALLNALGDILAQKIVDKNEHLDMKRLGIFTFLVITPATPFAVTACIRPFVRCVCADSAVDGGPGGAVHAGCHCRKVTVTVTLRCKPEGCMFSVQGFVIIGPPLHYWYLMLSRVSVQGLAGDMLKTQPCSSLNLVVR